MISELSSTRKSPGLSKFWKALHNSPHLTLHATLYTWAAENMQPGWVIDLGCEYGFGSLLIADINPKLRVLGMDLDFTALCYSQDMPGKEKIPWINANGFKLPIASGIISGVYLINLLHLTEEPGTMVSEVRRVLNSEGVAIVSIPQRDTRESNQHRSQFIDRLKKELTDQFPEVICPSSIRGRIPSFPPQSFNLDQADSTWTAICLKTNKLEKISLNERV
jgi:SAM-dependent methyltransferase